MDFVRKTARQVAIGDVVQHPIYPARWINVEWVGQDVRSDALFIAGWYGESQFKNDQREAVSFRPGQTVTLHMRRT